MVDGHDPLSTQKLDGQCRLAWVHREPAADGQEAQIGRIQVADDLHVAENGGIARVVNPFSVLEGQNEARRLSGVDARIVEARTVHGVGERDADTAEIHRSPFAHRARVLFGKTLVLGDQVHQFIGARHRASALAVHVHDGGDVIEVAVGEGDQVRLFRALPVVGAARVSRAPGVDVERRASGCKTYESGMSQICQSRAHDNPPYRFSGFRIGRKRASFAASVCVPMLKESNVRIRRIIVPKISWGKSLRVFRVIRDFRRAWG